MKAMENGFVPVLGAAICVALLLNGCAPSESGPQGESGRPEAGAVSLTAKNAVSPQVTHVGVEPPEQPHSSEAERLKWDADAASPFAEGKWGDLRPIPEIRTGREQIQNRGVQEGSVVPDAREEPAGEPTAARQWRELVLDDFEGALRWKPIAWENANDCDVSLANLAGVNALAIECKAGGRDKAGAMLSLPSPVDLSSFAVLSLHVRAKGGPEPPAAAMAIGWLSNAYFESVRKKLEAGTGAPVTFSLTSRDYKTAPRWEHNSALGGRVRALFVLLYYEEPCTVLITDLRVLGE